MAEVAGLADPHGGQPVLTAGPALQEAKAAVILLHGRGAGAADMMGLFGALKVEGICALVPQAAESTWYPKSFLAPLEENQPYLESALRRVGSVVDEAIAAGVAAERIGILGFSQGACLSCEFVARNPRRYGAVMGLTGGLVGPPGIEWDYGVSGGSLEGTPVFLGTSDPDMHVPYSRVEETRDVLAEMGAQVELRRYPGMPHTVNDEELEVCREMLRALVGKG